MHVSLLIQLVRRNVVSLLLLLINVFLGLSAGHIPLEGLLVDGQRLRTVQVYLKPFVLEHLIASDAFLRLFDQQLRDKMHGFLTDLFPAIALEAPITVFDLLEELDIILLREGHRARQQHVSDNTNAPKVAGLTVSLLHEDLGCNVAGRSACGAGEHIILVLIIRFLE